MLNAAQEGKAAARAADTGAPTMFGNGERNLQLFNKSPLR
jgi:hypothetical protein